VSASKTQTKKSTRPSTVPASGISPDEFGTILQSGLGILDAFLASRDNAKAAAAAAEAEAAEAREAERVEAERQEQLRREEQQRLFERDKQAVLDQLKGARVSDLQLKGAGSNALQFKGLGDLGGNGQNAIESAGPQTVPAPTSPSQIRAGWIAEPATPPPSAPGFKMPPMIGPEGATAYSVDTGQVVAAPGLPSPSATPSTAYSTDTGRTVTLSPGPGNTAYSVDTGKTVAAPQPAAIGAQPGSQPITGGGVSTAPASAGTTNTVPAASTNGSTTAGTTGSGTTAGTGVTRVVVASPYDGKYTTTVTVTTPPDVVPMHPTRTFTLGVLNGTPLATEIMGTIAFTGQLLVGRSQIQLLIGPSATIVIPVSGMFTTSGFAANGSQSCGTGICSVTITGTKLP